jgi:hypothetical protein
VLAQWLAEGGIWSGAGLWCWASRGDTGSIAALRRLTTARARGARHEGERALWQRLNAATEPYLLLARRDTAAALAAFAALPDSLAPCCTLFDRVTQARLLEARRADAAPAGVLERYPMPNDDGWPSRVFWSLLRARVHERLGNREQAGRDYAYVAAMWRSADPELQPYGEEARAGLARVSREAR